MDEKSRTSASKFLSFVLRHDPKAIDVVLDPAGWVDVEELLEKCRAHGRAISRAELEEIVRTSPKQRFALSADGLRVRANQGHSVEVDLGYAEQAPPEFLFHGTVASAIPAIRAGGLVKMARHHVHLSADIATARVVGARRGAAIVLVCAAARMHQAAHVFYLSANGVWLTHHVPATYIEFPDTAASGA